MIEEKKETDRFHGKSIAMGQERRLWWKEGRRERAEMPERSRVELAWPRCVHPHRRCSRPRVDFFFSRPSSFFLSFSACWAVLARVPPLAPSSFLFLFLGRGFRHVASFARFSSASNSSFSFSPLLPIPFGHREHYRCLPRLLADEEKTERREEEIGTGREIDAGAILGRWTRGRLKKRRNRSREPDSTHKGT